MTDTPISSSPAEAEQAQPILVAIDFSDDSRAALLWACEYADRVDARLILLHVVHDLAAHPGFYHPDPTDELQPMQDVAESMMDDFLDDMKDRCPDLKVLDQVETRLIPGLPPGRIVEVAGLLNARLIVMGCHGMTGPDNKRLGSVAEHVVELAPEPVVLVKSERSRKLTKKERKRNKEKKRNEEKKRKKEKKKLKLLRKQQIDTDG